MKTPQIVYLALCLIGLLTAVHDHGKPRSDNNFWTVLISGVISLGLLYWGGFFTN